MEDFDKYLDWLVENFYDTGKLVLNEYSNNIHDFIKQTWKVTNLSISALKSEGNLNGLGKLIESAIEWNSVIDILDKMDDDDLSKISRGGSHEWVPFKKSSSLNNVTNIRDAVSIQQSQTNKRIENTYEELINKIHADSKTSENIEEIIGRYEELKVLIEKLSETSYYPKKIQLMLSRLDDNINRNSILINDWISKHKEITKQYYGNKSSEDSVKNIEDYIKNLKDLKVDYNLLPPEKKGKIIDYFKYQYDKKGGFDFNIGNFVEWIDNIIKNQEEETERVRKDLETYRNKYLSSITPEQSEESFDKIVDDIDVKKVDDGDLSGILSNYSIDGELVVQRKELLKKIKEIKSKIKNVDDKKEKAEKDGEKNWENIGKTKKPIYEEELNNLEEQLKIIDPIKSLFGSDKGWANNYVNCSDDKKLYDELLTKYYGKITNAHNTLLNKTQKDTLDTKGQIGDRDCEKYNLQKLTTVINRVSNREDIKNELTTVFTEYNKNGVITNLVNKTINLVDNIFKIIIDKKILTNTPLQRYRSYMNMIKIYSQGENQKEKLTQLVYDLNQLKNVVESYDVLTGTADSPQTSDEEDTQEEGAKLLSIKGIQSLLNDISKNSWDKEKIKDYFVKVREHNNVAYEKSFEKECNGTQYFKKVTGGDSPRIIDKTNNNTHLVDYILSADTKNKYIATEKIVETVFGEVKNLLADKDSIENRLKKYDLKVLSAVTLTNGSDTITLSPSSEKFIEVKLTKPQDYHFSEFFGVYKSTKSKVYKRMKNLVEDGSETDVKENFKRYNDFVEGLVDKLISEEGSTIIDNIKSKLQGIFFSNYEFCSIDDVKFSWSTVGQGKEGGREKRVTLRIVPDINKLYTWKEGNPNCDRFKFVGCDEIPGCSQNESTDTLDKIIENFFDTGKFVI